MKEIREPSNFIQWKGTPACMDFHCSCGTSYHLDNADFIYHIECVACNRIWKMGSEVSMQEVAEDDGFTYKTERSQEWKE